MESPSWWVNVSTALDQTRAATIDLRDGQGYAVFNEGGRVKRAVGGLLTSLAAMSLSCGGSPQGLGGPSTLPIGNRSATPSGVDAATPVFPTEIFVGAGDIAQCTNGGVPQATARLLDSIDGTVFTLGDNAYPSGTAEDYRTCYDTTWGRHRARTRPVPGNHEYDSGSPTPYFDYFGASAGPSGAGFYSYELGNWHVIALNSNIPVGARSAQAEWLRNDLAASSAKCTIAYWHFPLFSSSKHGNIEQMRDFWRILYDNNADVVLSAHDHTYERFALQDPDGNADPDRGIREFVAGTGGAPVYPFIDVKPNSEVRLGANGVLRLALKAGGYDWNFISTSGPGDSGSATCH
jgi:calcineurin-like phosphoesterase family protein